MRLKGEFTNTIEIEKSKFITYMNRCFDEDECKAYILKIKKLHPNATHHCTAFVCKEHNELQRSNDDSEPSGTAGAPMLNVLTSSNIQDICVVCVRYFGGIKLGTGGLVRAYSRSVSEALALAPKVDLIKMQKYSLEISYDLINKINYYLKDIAVIEDVIYDETVKYTILTNHQITNDISELTKGQFIPKFIQDEIIEKEI